MQEALVEGAVETGVVVLETALVGILTTLGLLSEQAGIASLNGGELLGLWYLYMGGLALYAGLYVLGYGRLVPRIRQRLTA
jgi:hypothetical protein